VPVTLLQPPTIVSLPSKIGFLRFLAILTLALAVGAARQLWITTLIDYGISPFSVSWFAIWTVVGLSVLLAAAWFLAVLLPQIAANLSRLEIPHIASSLLCGCLWIIAALSFVPLTLFVLHPFYGRVLEGRTWLKLDLLWWQSLVLAACLIALRKEFRAPGAIATAVIAQAASYRTLVYLPDLSAYPLSLAYSEASQLFESSQFFGRLVYGTPLALPVLNPALHLLLGLPFLLPHSPLWLHRLWAVILRSGLMAALSWLLARRMKIESRLIVGVFAGWAYLFLFQGPVYFHLTIPVIILLVAFDPERPGRSWGAVLLASAWAGISRINWFPVPSLLAACLYLLEVAVSSEGGNWRRHLGRPVAWLLAGTATAFATWRIYVAVSGNDPGMFASSLTSDLLWYRLFPNSVDPLGLLPGVLIVSIAPALIIFMALRRNLREWHVLRLAGLAAALVVLLLGGLVVSVKIGGGGDLHNLDAFIILLLITTSALFWGRFAPEISRSEAPGQPPTIPWPALALAVAVPVILAASQGAPVLRRDEALARDAIARLQQRVEEVQQNGGQVLFIDERQLLAFGQISRVRWVEPYEKELLMEMVMAHNEPYIREFQQALREQRYAMIVARSIGGYYKDRVQPWAEENNVWVESVGSLLACEYQQETLMPGMDLIVLLPREGATCP
jgi:hypothetical protein